MHTSTIRDKIRAGYPSLFLFSPEEGRAEAALLAVAEELDYELHAWSVNVVRFEVRLSTTAGRQPNSYEE